MIVDSCSDFLDRCEAMDSRIGAPGPLAHLRSRVSSQEVGYVC